ncbi:hypothetical protein V1478_009559 [Vespula squamosa]|uniref:Uncharacterized protein n=1 Tax=Vespula squamosa TaxID=30214 RepID=A0ABD2AQ02_VESSQ
MSNITFYLRSLYVITTRESVPWQLRCALLGSQTKTELNIEGMSNITFYLRSFFVITTRERIL